MALLALLWAPAASADTVEVDLQLVLAADVSGSMSVEERRVQREGYVAALSSLHVARAVASGGLGKVAIAYFEWATAEEQAIVVPWTVVESRDDLRRFASVLEQGPAFSTFSSGTSISGALLFAAGLFERNGAKSFRRVIDISGDGANDDGPPVEGVRDQVVSLGITINAISVQRRAFPGRNATMFNRAVPDLHRYFSKSVIGGARAFAVVARGEDDFARALEQKLVLEIANGRDRHRSFDVSLGQVPLHAVRPVRAARPEEGSTHHPTQGAEAPFRHTSSPEVERYLGRAIRSCEEDSRHAVIQFETLTVAQLVAVECQPEVGA